MERGFIKFEQFIKFNHNKTTKRDDIPVYEDLFIPKGLKVVVSVSGKKGHSIIAVPGINMFHEVKGSPAAIITKIDLENEEPKPKKTTSK